MTPADLMTEDMLHIYTADVLRAFVVPGVVWWHTPNSGKHHINYRVKMKKRGLRAGVSDFIILAPDYGLRFVGFLELKDADGDQSDAQEKFQHDVEAIGFPYEIARTPEEVDGILSAWGAINKPIRGTLSAGAGASGRMGAANIARSRSHSSKKSSSPRASESRSNRL